jgi:hypothetical protein
MLEMSGSARRGPWRRVCAVVLGAGVGACHPPPVSVSTLQSTAYLVGAEPLTRLVVYSDLEGPAVTHAASAEFERGVVQRLGTCGVEARVVSADRMDPTPPERRVEAALARLETHAVMVVKAAGGELKTGWRSPNRLTAKLELTDVRTRRATWVADATAYFSTADAGTDGDAFAALLVTRLRDDGVLTRCRPGEAYPGCFEDRRQAEQAQLPAPRCDVASSGGS